MDTMQRLFEIVMQVVRKKNGMGNSVSASSIADERLQSAANRFTEFKVKLRKLQNALLSHHTNLVLAENSRKRILEALTSVSQDSPTFDLVGAAAAAQASPSHISFAAVQTDCARSMSLRLTEQYQEEILAYMTNWESTVTTRIATELGHVDKLYKVFVRYHNKVESLQASAEKHQKTEAKLDRLRRNESKLRTARKEYRRNLVGVTLLTEEVTDRGWKDLIPLVVKLIDYDVDTSKTRAEFMAKLVNVKKEMEALAKRFEMDEVVIRNGRLEVLLEEEAMEFVKPEHLQDIESIQASISTYYPSRLARHQAAPSHMMSPTESENTENESEEEEKVDAATRPFEAVWESEEVRATAPQDPANKKSSANKPAAPPNVQGQNEEDEEDEASIPNYPSSIYLNSDDLQRMQVLDDETTLTDYLGVASC